MARIRHVIPVVVSAALSAAVPTTSAEPESGNQRSLVDKIIEVRKKTWHWQDVMQRKRMDAGLGRRGLSRRSNETQARILSTWRNRTTRVRRAAYNPPHEREFRCIHRHEGPWDANTGNGYYGGLQMDLTFQRQYAPRRLRKKGTADKWTPVEQIWVGERARREGRGFYPWPTAARRCGLI
jgi:Transglycosylase-like domain